MTPSPTITDDETATVSFSSNSSSAAENAGSVTAAVVLNLTWTDTAEGSLQDAINISITDVGTGSASTPADYTLESNSLTFAAGAGNDATQDIAISIIDDSVDEDDETATVRLTVSSGEATTAVPRSHTLTITDNDTQAATVEFSSSGFATTDETGTTYNVDVVLMTADGQPLINPVTVDVSDLGTGSATAATDYSFSTTTLTFAASAASGSTQTAMIAVVADTEDESDETVNLGLGNVTGSSASLGALTSYTLTISDDDTQTATVEFSSSGFATIDETGTTYNVDVVITTSDGQPLINPVTVDVSDLGTGSATAATDYNFSTTTLTFAASAASGSTQSATIAVVSDNEDESDETVDLSLSNVTGSNASLGSQTSHTFTITDDDTTVVQTASVEFSTASASTTDEVGTTYNVDVVLTTSDGQPLVNAISVDVSDLGTGSATATADYNFSTTTLTFAASAASGSTQSATIAVVSDNDDESDEDVDLGLGNVTGSNASLGSQTTHTLTITDDDTAGTPGVTISRTTLSARPGAARTYTVVLNTQPTGDVVIAITQPVRCTVRPHNLTFTAANWNIPQTVKVTVRATSLPRTRCVMRHSAMGGGYDGLSISRVVLTIR